MHVDPSNKELRCALYQRIYGEIKILDYGNKTLYETEQKYHNSKLEFLGIKWVVTEHFRDYLLYASVVDVYRDNNPLVYVRSSTKLNATGQIRVNQLADFNLTLHYKPGIINLEADCFSRFPQYIRKHTEITSQVDINKLMNSVTEPKEDTSTCLCSVNSINNLITEEQQQNKNVTLKEVDITEMQDEDKDIKRVKEILKQQTVLNIDRKQQENQLVRRFLREINKLSITDKDILVRSPLEHRQIVLPLSHNQIIFQELHESMAHLELIECISWRKGEYIG